MAGKKKQAQLTPEEKLQQALVPEAEQPYKVPANWCWLHLLYSFINCTDSNKKIKQKEYLKEGILPIVDQGKDLIGGFTNNKELAFKGDLPVIIFGDHTRCVKYVDFNFVQGADGVKVLKPQIFYNEKLFYYALKNIDIKNLGYRRHFPTFDQYFVPLPPLAEQQRIVERIESIFAKLDEAKENLQNVLDGFETRKAAILHKAFTGELTGKKSDKVTTLENIVEAIKIGPFGSSLHKEDYIEYGVPIINPKHIVNQQIIAENKVSISVEKAEELSSYKLQENDIILGRRGEMGRSAPISKNEEGWICGTGSLIIRLKKGYNALFYSQIIASQTVVQYLESNSVGSTLKNLNEKIVRKIPIPDYTFEEQTEIVRIIDGLLAKEQQAKQLAENALAKIEIIKKAILARAFRGELGTNNPADEPAVELLKRVL